jgi:hypothetical protein
MNRKYYDEPTDEELEEMFRDSDREAGPSPWVALVILFGILAMLLISSKAFAQNEEFGGQVIDRSISYDNIGRRAGMCGLHNRPLYLQSCKQKEIDRCLNDNLPSTHTMAEVNVIHEACKGWGEDPKVVSQCKAEALDKVIRCMGLEPPKQENYLDD